MISASKRIGRLILTFILISQVVFSYAQAERKSFSLEEAKNYAVQNSYMTTTAQKEITKSEKKVNETIGTGLPQVSLGANYQQYIQVPLSLIPASAVGGPEGQFLEVFFGTEQQMGASARVDQLIFDGSYFVGLQASKVYLELSKNDLARTENEIKSLVTQAYGGVLVAQRNAEILKGNIENLEQSVFETNELYKNGFVEEQDYDQIRLLLANVQNSFQKAERMGEIAKNQLKFVLGLPMATAIELTDELKDITTNYTNVISEFDASSHIEYKILQTQEKASELLMKQQKSTALPRIGAFYSFQTNAFADEFDFLDNKQFYSGQLIGLNLSLPLFTGLSRHNRIEQAKIDIDQVQIAKQQVEHQLLINAENAKSDYLFALSQYQTTEENLNLANSIYNKTKIKYEEGINTSLDLTQASNQVLETQANYINAAFELINAKAALDKALNR